MNRPIYRIEIRQEQDLVYARQRARRMADLLGFDRNDQTRICTALSEIARNAFQYAGGGEIVFGLESVARSQVLVATVRDRGPGIKDIKAILEGRYTSATGMGMGLVGSRRLMDQFRIETQPGQGTTVSLGKRLPPTAPEVTPEALRRVVEALAAMGAESPLEETRQQNQELLNMLDELHRRREELEDTNRGVLALYAELDEKVIALRGVDQLKSSFLSNVSHELRTPLNAMLALSRMLLNREDGELTEEQAKQVTFIHQGAETLSVMVNDLLDLAKIQAGKIDIRSRECMVEELFSGLRGLLKPLALNPAVALVFDPPDGLPPLFTDDGKVSQILRNLLSNALKFTERGMIRVAARLGGEGQTLIFTVADTGIGLAPQDQERIFDEYSQVETAQQGKPKGTGLGLPISRKLAELLGGHLDVHSRLGEGSTFTLTLPVRHGEAEAEAEPAGALPPGALLPGAHPSPSVLVVEDDPATQVIYQNHLRASGFEVVPVYTIREARQALQRLQPAAILLDIVIPGESEDGWSFLAEVRGHPATRDIPVIVASAYESRGDGLSARADEYCVKPIERTWLLRRLRELTQCAPIEKILIIDDQEVARYIVKGHLAESGCTLLEAGDGATGLALAEAEQPGAIVLDLAMPGMDGFEVLRRLKGNPATRAIPVIISTSSSLDEGERHLLEGESLAVLSKGALGREEIMAAVKAALHIPDHPQGNQGELLP